MFLLHSIKRRLLKKNLTQVVLGIFGRSLNPNKWIFVVGCYNSGTSLLAQLISLHPSCSGTTNEGVALTNQLPTPEKYGWPRIWKYCLKELEIHPDDIGSQKKALKIKKQWSLSFNRKSPVLVEKSISNAARIPFFAEYFQPAFFIHIVRDGHAVAEGIRRKAKPYNYNNKEHEDEYPIQLCIEQWILANNIISNSLEKNSLQDRSVVITYEDLCENPKDVMNSIYELVGLNKLENFDELLLASNIKGVSNMNKKSHDSLSAEDKKIIHEIAEKDLTHWGYFFKENKLTEQQE